MLKTLSDSLLAVIYPEDCHVCRGEVESQSDGIVCSDCWNTTRIFRSDETPCSKCGAFLFAGSSKCPTTCRKCDDQHFDSALAIGSYEKALAASVLELKKSPRLVGRVKDLLVELTEQMSFRNSDVIIPVPLSPRRLQERGFNQAAVIGKFVSKQLAIPLDEATLIRRIDTPMHRAGMDRKARGVTVKNAFVVSRPKLIQEKNILLIDDVFTSGETVSSCAKILKKNGAARVDVITLARAA